MFATTVDYWSKDMGFGIDYKNISVGLRMCKHFPQVKFLDKAKIFAGIGSTLHFVEIASLSTTKIGVDTFGGFAYPLSGRLNIKTEAGYRFVTDISQMYLSATFIYKFR
jgi:opacity protein-like surface antigen